jgi:hypothetical protein
MCLSRENGHEKNYVGDIACGAGDGCTRVVEQANHMRKTARVFDFLTHGGRAGLHGTEKESAKGMQVYEWNFVTGL